MRQESQNIDAQYEKKRKQAEVGWKMYVTPTCSHCFTSVMLKSGTPVLTMSSNQSTALNNSRISVLKSRNDQLNTLFEDATKQVKELSGKKEYEKALESLILEVSSAHFQHPPHLPLSSSSSPSRYLVLSHLFYVILTTRTGLLETPL